MDIFDYAMQLEREGEGFYRAIVADIENKGLRTIFNWLAEEEVKHYKVLQEMKAGDTYKLVETHLLDDAKNVFKEMINSVGKLEFDESELEAYRKAQEIEKKSQEFYLQKAKEVGSHSQKEIFLNIAKEEEKHYFLLENIIDFVSRPQMWLENAEFNHLDDY